ncbi:hypothetical protein BDF14DRAFT_1997200 [Spinellus fusiger]|nr:hypothetical protein BDF14DRAFT_1997200 [Spinellus fusiger]
MLDSIFTKIKEEVAIRGYQGICIEEVWSIVENETIRKIKERGATEDPTPTIDMAYKNYVWKFMRIIKEINYYEKIGEEIAPTNNIAGTFDGLKKEDISILNRKPETRDGEKRLKAARAKVARIARERRLKKEKEKKKQKDSDMDDDEGDVDDVKIVRNANQMQLRTEKPDNYKLIPNIKTIEYSEIIERYGGTLYVVATEKLQKEQLFLAIPAGRTLSPNTTYVLFTILQAKNVGIPQRDLTKVLNLDSRSTGHYVKVLEKRGAIVRKCYSYQGITTRLCIHVRFNRPDLRIQFQEENNEADMADISDKLMPYNVNTLGVPYSPKMLDNSITDVLLDAKDNVMFSHDIMKALGFNSKRFRVRKWFNRAIDIFCLRGHIQKFVATDRLKGKVLRCLKLTDPIKAIAIREGARTTVHVREKDDKRFEVPIIKKRDPLLPISGILKDSTLDSQILAHLIEAGTKGYTQKEIAKLTSCGDNRMLYKLMDKLAKLTGPASDSYVCRRELEFGGRNRRYRYFYKKSDDKENDITSFIKLEHPPTNIPEGSISEINHFNHAPTQIRIPTHRRGRPPKSETQKAKEKVSAINIYPKRPVLTGEREYASVFSSPSSMEIEPSKRNETKKKETKRKEAKGKEPKENNPEEKEVEKEVEKICGRKRSLRATITSSNTSVKRPSVRKRAKSKIENQKPLVFTTMEEPVPTSSTSVDDNVMEITSTEKKDDQQENESPSTALTVGEDGSFTVCLTRQVLGPTISVPAPTKGKRGRKPALSNSKYSSSIAKVEKAPLKRSSRKQKIAESLPKPLEDVSDIDPNTTELPPTRNELSHKVEFNMTQSISACTSVIDPVDVSRENTLNKATLTVSEDTTVDTPSASKRKFQSINSSEDDTTAIDEHVEEISTSVKKKEPVKRTKISDFFKVSTPKKSVTRSSTHQATPTNEQKDEPIMIEQESAKSNLSVEPENNINVLAKPTFENMPIALASREITEEKMDIDEIHQQENDSSTEIVKAETNSPSDATATADTSLEIDLITADPPCPSVSELNSNVAEALAKKISQNPLNAYLEQRKVVLLACLDETPFIERGVAIRRLYKQKYEQLFGQPKIKSSICLKTIWRSAVSLEKEGKVKLYNESYTHLNGSTVIKRYIIRRDIDINGPDMKRYITHLSMDRALQPSVYATSKFEKLNTHVEGIDERLLRMEKSLEVAIAEEKHNEFKKLENQIRSLKNNLKVSIAAENLTNPSDKKNFGNWMMIASQYGYINSRMIRAKELHQFMDTLLYKNVPEIDANERIIPVVSMIKYMPLRLYLQIIGMFNPSKDFQEYIKIPGNSEMLITDLPQHLRLLMLHKKGRLRQHIRVALDILESLNIIKRRGYKVPDMLVSSGSGEYTDSNQYTLALEVPIMNLKNKEQNIIRTYKLQTNSDIHIYWSDLQYLCTHEEVKGPEIELITDSLPLRSFLSTIFSHRNWSVSYQFSHYQRAALNSHVDKIEGLTPMRNIKLCKDLAEKLGISLTTIRGYYRKVEDAFIRKREENSVKKIERSLRPTRRSRKSSLASKEGRNITLKTLHAFKRRKHWTIAQRLVSKQEDLYKMNPSLRPTDTDKKEPYLDNYEDAPYLSEHLIEMGLVPDNFRRSKWSEREEEILIYSYVIIKERSSHSRFVWSAMRNVIPDRRPSTSRYRIAKLKKNQQSVERLAYLSHIWRIFYNEGCKNGDIVDNNIYDMVDFDLLGQLEYFFKRLMDTPM